MDKKRIAFMIPGLGRVRRGAETTRSDLVNLLKDNFQITAFSLKKANSLCQTSWAIRQDSLVLKKIYQLTAPINPVLGRYFSYWPAEVEMLTFSFSLFPKLLKGKYDIFFPVSIWGVMMARILRFLVGTKFVYINHGGAENFILKQKPDVFIAVTDDVLCWAQKAHPKVKSVLIPHAVDLSIFSPQIKPAELDLERPIFLSVGALTDFKRLPMTIKAVSGLDKGGLVILGEGELKKKIQKLGDRLLGKKRFLLNSVAFDRMAAYYAAADVFTLASREEIFGNVYLEALASGLPVVAPADKRRKFIVGKAGILVDVTDIKKYSQALKKAVKKDWQDLPRQQAKKFSHKNQVKKYRQLINELEKD